MPFSILLHHCTACQQALSTISDPLVQTGGSKDLCEPSVPPSPAPRWSYHWRTSSGKVYYCFPFQCFFDQVNQLVPVLQVVMIFFSSLLIDFWHQCSNQPNSKYANTHDPRHHLDHKDCQNFDDSWPDNPTWAGGLRRGWNSPPPTLILPHRLYLSTIFIASASPSSRWSTPSSWSTPLSPVRYGAF